MDFVQLTFAPPSDGSSDCSFVVSPNFVCLIGWPFQIIWLLTHHLHYYCYYYYLQMMFISISVHTSSQSQPETTDAPENANSTMSYNNNPNGKSQSQTWIYLYNHTNVFYCCYVSCVNQVYILLCWTHLSFSLILECFNCSKRNHCIWNNRGNLRECKHRVIQQHSGWGEIPISSDFYSSLQIIEKNRTYMFFPVVW